MSLFLPIIGKEDLRLMLSQKARYSIRALQYLATRYGKGFVPLSEIVADQNIPAKFLTVILSEFSRTGIVATQRGRDGGYRLAVRLGWNLQPLPASSPSQASGVGR